ncbi:diguanylate phosphodiesterase, partial [Enterobacter cloacae]|nr:diguanylate phosphodiesterase [Enterobacter cloacae]
HSLCHQEGMLADMVALCRYYEQQEWGEAARMAKGLGLSDDEVVDAMRTATIWAGENAAG